MSNQIEMLLQVAIYTAVLPIAILALKLIK